MWSRIQLYSALASIAFSSPQSSDVFNEDFEDDFEKGRASFHATSAAQFLERLANNHYATTYVHPKTQKILPVGFTNPWKEETLHATEANISKFEGLKTATCLNLCVIDEEGNVFPLDAAAEMVLSNGLYAEMNAATLPGTPLWGLSSKDVAQVAESDQAIFRVAETKAGDTTVYVHEDSGTAGNREMTIQERDTTEAEYILHPITPPANMIREGFEDRIPSDKWRAQTPIVLNMKQTNLRISIEGERIWDFSVNYGPMMIMVSCDRQTDCKTNIPKTTVVGSSGYAEQTLLKREFQIWDILLPAPVTFAASARASKKIKSFLTRLGRLNDAPVTIDEARGIRYFPHGLIEPYFDAETLQQEGDDPKVLLGLPEQSIFEYVPAFAAIDLPSVTFQDFEVELVEKKPMKTGSVTLEKIRVNYKLYHIFAFKNTERRMYADIPLKVEILEGTESIFKFGPTAAKKTLLSSLPRVELGTEVFKMRLTPLMKPSNEQLNFTFFYKSVAFEFSLLDGKLGGKVLEGKGPVSVNMTTAGSIDISTSNQVTTEFLILKK